MDNWTHFLLRYFIKQGLGARFLVLSRNDISVVGSDVPAVIKATTAEKGVNFMKL
jgi:hypothetical protein